MLVVITCLVEGCTYRETAEILEIPVGTVMSRLHRGRKFLQMRLLEQARERGFERVTAAPELSRTASFQGIRS